MAIWPEKPFILGTYWNNPYHYINLRVEGIQTASIGFGVFRESAGSSSRILLY